MVDHTFLFTGAVRKIKQLLQEGALGQALLLRFHARQPGTVPARRQRDLGSGSPRSVDHGLPDRGEARAVVATGQTHLNGHEDVAFITLYFPNNVIAHINVNWLSPVKVRTTLIGGEKKMLVWNDLEADEKIKVYDKGVKVTSREGVYNLLVNYRSGDMWAPQLEQVEALRQELAYFVDCITKNQTPFNDGLAGLRVVKMLEAASHSLRHRGAAVYLDRQPSSSVPPPSFGEDKQPPVVGIAPAEAAAAAASLRGKAARLTRKGFQDGSHRCTVS